MSPYAITRSQWVNRWWASWLQHMCITMSRKLTRCGIVNPYMPSLEKILVNILISCRYGLLIVRHQAINGVNANLLSTGALGTNLWGISTFTLLTHWGRVTHICVGNLAIIGSNNGLSPGRRQAIIWTSAGILLIGRLGTNFSEILIGI